MRRLLFVLLNCSVAAALGAMGIATMNILYMMFSTKEEGVRKTGIWGSVFFESIKNPNGSLTVEAGLASWLPLIGVWAFLTIILFVIYLTHKWLRAYRESLLESSKSV